MPTLRFLTAGESHGPGLTVIVDGLPAGLGIDPRVIAADLRRRQGGYGRGGRMAIEEDRAEIRGGVRHGFTTGGPVALWIENRDFANWNETMSPGPVPGGLVRELTRPRPGHADLAGTRKLGLDDARNVLERASARETAARVAAGTLAKVLLETLDTRVQSHTIALGEVASGDEEEPWESIQGIADEAPFRTARAELDAPMRRAVDEARAAGDTLGGIFEVVAHTPPPGLGHFSHWDLRLDGRIAQAMLSIPAARTVAFGTGERLCSLRGSALHDVIRHEPVRGLFRPTNRAGGIEGGMTNGEEVRVRVGMKPLSTLAQPLESVDLRSLKTAPAGFERSDVTVVPAAGVVGEAMLALVLAGAALEKFGGDSLGETERNYRAYVAACGWVPRG